MRTLFTIHDERIISSDGNHGQVVEGVASKWKLALRRIRVAL